MSYNESQRQAPRRTGDPGRVTKTVPVIRDVYSESSSSAANSHPPPQRGLSSVAQRSRGFAARANVLEQASIESAAAIDDGYATSFKGPEVNEHSFSIIQSNANGDGHVNIISGNDFKDENVNDFIRADDFAQSNKITKLIVKVRQPRHEASHYGPIQDIGLQIHKRDANPSANFRSLNRNVNANANTDNASVQEREQASNAFRLNKIVIGESKKRSVKKQATRKFIPPEQVSSSEDFHSIKEADSVIESSQTSFEVCPQRNNNAMSSASSSSSSPLNRSGGNQPHTSVNKSSSNSSSLNHSLQEAEVGGQPPVEPATLATEEKPQKLTLNAQIKLKIYQNEQGDIAVQQQPASRIASLVDIQANVGSSAGATTHSQTTLITGETITHESSSDLRGKKSFTRIVTPLTEEQRQKILRQKEELESQGFTVTENTGTVFTDRNNSNNNNSLTTKNIYMKQRRLSAINNKVLFYEEKEMQMSETSTLLSDQESNDYNPHNKQQYARQFQQKQQQPQCGKPPRSKYNKAPLDCECQSEPDTNADRARGGRKLK